MQLTKSCELVVQAHPRLAITSSWVSLDSDSKLMIFIKLQLDSLKFLSSILFVSDAPPSQQLPLLVGSRLNLETEERGTTVKVENRL
ncbi:unnamed protein product [Porites evermanni]|uniref:Uncharacterized protein n=1 Tax=Porites evermanni TaxID=104178 RepID=A0ABN8R072_9CNID|nr:unnamed protein product [Porites evermanni]